MPLQSGTFLGPYQLEGHLGAGGMGEVYRARDTRLGRTVAVKILPSRVAGREDLCERFEREAKAISLLNHPHICTLHDVASATADGEEIHFLVMDHIEGETLATGFDLLAVVEDGRGPVRELVRTRFWECGATISPSEDLLAYAVSDLAAQHAVGSAGQILAVLRNTKPDDGKRLHILMNGLNPR